MRMATPAAGSPVAQPTTLSGAAGQVAPRRRAPLIAGVAIGAIAIGGIVVAVLATGHKDTKPEPAPPVAASVTLPVSKPVEAAPIAPVAPVAPAKVALQFDADVPGARVVFRRRVTPTPLAIEIAPIDVVELVEVSAPSHKTERYWLTFDRPTHLRAHLVRGSGIEEATEEQTLVALGEAAAPPPPAVVAAAPTAEPVPVPPRPTPRKIGKAVADEPAKVAVVEAPAPAPTPAPEPAPAPAPVPAPVAPPAPSRNVSTAELRNLLASKTAVEVPSIVETQMKRDDKKTAAATVKVCLGPTGEVTATSLLKSSGYPAYDERAVAAIRGWHYKPYLVDGHGVAVCSAVTESLALK